MDGTYQPCTPVGPTCGITASSTSITAGGTVTFSDGSSGVPDTWAWNFDNTSQGGVSPASSTVQNPGTITYSTPGTYEVELFASNAQGNCNTTITITVSASLGCDTLTNIAATRIGALGDVKLSANWMCAAGHPELCATANLTWTVDADFPCDRSQTDALEECVQPFVTIRGPEVVGGCPDTPIALDASDYSGSGIRPLRFEWMARSSSLPP